MMKFAIIMHFILGIVQLSYGKKILQDENSHELHLDYKSDYSEFDSQDTYFYRHITLYYIFATLIAVLYLTD